MNNNNFNMKSIVPFGNKILCLVIIYIILPMHVFSQENAPTPENAPIQQSAREIEPPPPASIDGLVLSILVLALVFGFFVIYKKKKSIL